VGADGQQENGCGDFTGCRRKFPVGDDSAQQCAGLVAAQPLAIGIIDAITGGIALPVLLESVCFKRASRASCRYGKFHERRLSSPVYVLFVG
jgi:hypothetical protein